MYDDKAADRDALPGLAPAGYYLALRVGFAFPIEEVNALPKAWVDHYTRGGLLLDDPVMRWVHGHTGTVRCSELAQSDPVGVLQQAKRFGMVYGLVAAVTDAKGPERSWGMFMRDDREYDDAEAVRLLALVEALHREKSPPTNLTRAEIEVLRMVKNGLRIKQIAYEIGVTDGAIKQRLKNARIKLDAATATQAATLASDFGLI
ncbi:helix-turn-helix transcriptional regulator [Pseudoroseicyclus aestuarii]|uniref:LuxR family transcriptional regulator n=1 Tax=Pseudoroseicyclus aestuarii TaxID=1795041 RepID=A0A318SYL5_9RHOB|nr:autoinducer binding domain-containing protein [Pseudoroseicyclus aestuarii]PYE85499.1 LuxR family transcriptional regulator [Pseudoroseicyclus aestuarii]